MSLQSSAVSLMIWADRSASQTFSLYMTVSSASPAHRTQPFPNTWTQPLWWQGGADATAGSGLFGSPKLAYILKRPLVTEHALLVFNFSGTSYGKCAWYWLNVTHYFRGTQSLIICDIEACGSLHQGTARVKDTTAVSILQRWALAKHVSTCQLSGPAGTQIKKSHSFLVCAHAYRCGLSTCVNSHLETILDFS